MPLSYQNAQPAYGRQRKNAALLGRGVKDESPKPQQRRPIGQPSPLNRMPIGSSSNDEPRHLTPRQHQDILRNGGIAVAPKEFVFHGVGGSQQPPVTVGSRMSNMPQRSPAPRSSPSRPSHLGNNPILKGGGGGGPVSPLPIERHSHSDGILPSHQYGGNVRSSPSTPPGLSSNRTSQQHQPPHHNNNNNILGAAAVPPRQYNISPASNNNNKQNYHPTGAVNHYREKQQARQNDLLIRQHQIMYNQQRENAQQQYHYLLGDAPQVPSPLKKGPPVYEGEARGWVHGNDGGATPKASPSKGPRDELHAMAQNAGGHHNQHQSVPRGASNDPPHIVRGGSESVYAILAPESSSAASAAPLTRNPPPAPLNPKHIQQRLPAQGQHSSHPYHPAAAPGSHDQQHAAYHNSPLKKQQIPARGQSNSTASNAAPPPHHQQQVQHSVVPGISRSNTGSNNNVNQSNMMPLGSMSGEEEFHPAASLPFEIVYCSSEVQGRQIASEGPHGSKLPTPTASKSGSGDKIGEEHTVGEIMKSLEMHWDELEANNNNESEDTSTTSGVDGSKNHHGKPPVLSNGWLTHPAPNTSDADPEALEDSYPVELILRFPEGDADIKQIQLLTHEYKIPTKVEIRIFSLEKHLAGHKERLQQLYQKEEKRRQKNNKNGGGAGGDDQSGGVPRRSPVPPGIDDADDVSTNRRELRSTALATLHHNALPSFKDVKFAKLGSVAFSNNEKSRFKAKERKTVHVNTRAYFVKLLFHAPHSNQYNNNDTRHQIAFNEKGSTKIFDFVGSQLGVYSILSLGDQSTTTTGNPAAHVDTPLYTPNRAPAMRHHYPTSAQLLSTPSHPVDDALVGAGGNVVHRNLTRGGSGRSHHHAIGGGINSNRPPDREKRDNEQLADDELYKQQNGGGSLYVSQHRSTGPTPEVPEVFDAPAYDMPQSRFPPINQRQASNGPPHQHQMDVVPPHRRSTIPSVSAHHSSPPPHHHGQEYGGSPNRGGDNDAYPCLFSSHQRHPHAPTLADIRSRPITHYESYYMRIHKQLMDQKSEAIDREDFDHAKLVKGKLVILQEKTKLLQELEAEKVKVMIEEDFERAIELRDRMNRVIKEVYSAVASTTVETTAVRQPVQPPASRYDGEGDNNNPEGSLPNIHQNNNRKGGQQQHVIQINNEGKDEDLWDGRDEIPEKRQHQPNRQQQPPQRVVDQDDQPVMSKYAQKMADERRRGEDGQEDDDYYNSAAESSGVNEWNARENEPVVKSGTRNVSPPPPTITHHQRQQSSEAEASGSIRDGTENNAAGQQQVPPFYERWEDAIVAYIHKTCDDAVKQQRHEAQEAAGGNNPLDDEAFPMEPILTESATHQTNSLGGGGGGSVDVKRTEVGPLQHAFGAYTTACLLSRRWRLREAAMKCIRANLLTLYSNPGNPSLNTSIGAATEAAQKSNNTNINNGSSASPYVQSAVLTLIMYLDVKGLGITDPVASVAIAACGMVEAIAAREFNGNEAPDESGGRPTAPYYTGALQNLLPRLMFRVADPSPSAGKVREECSRIIVNVLPELHALGVDRVVIGGILPHPTDADKKRLGEPIGTKVQLSRVTLFSHIMDKYRGTKSGKIFAQIIGGGAPTSDSSDSSTFGSGGGGGNTASAPRVLSLEILLKKLIIPSLNHQSTEVREAAVAAFGKIPVDFSSAKVSGSDHFQRFIQMIKNPTVRAVIEERLVSSLPPPTSIEGSEVTRRSPSPQPPVTQQHQTELDDEL